MLKIQKTVLLLLLQVIEHCVSEGTKGAQGNQWNQEPPQQRWPQTKGPIGGWDDEVSNPQGRLPDQGSMWKLEDSIPGVPGQSYPNFRKLPDTSFDCRKQIGSGYYGDTEAQCQVFHICQADGRQNSFLCPIGTIFNQQTFTCDWWFNVNCFDTSMHYVRNGNLYRSPDIGIDGMKVTSYGPEQQGGGKSQQPAVGIPNSDSGTKGRNWPSQSPGRSQQPAVGIPNSDSGTKGRNWPSQSPGRSQEPAVGIPNSDSGTKGRNWPSQSQGRSEEPWRSNQGGSQKGDGRSVNQRRTGGGNNWQNQGSENNFGRDQKGSRRGQYTDQQQQHAQTNQRGGSFQRTWNNNNQGRNRRGGIQNPQRQMFNQHMGMKGGLGNVGNQGNQNTQIGFPRTDDNMGRGRGNQNRGMNSNKGFDTNTWSIRAGNFRKSSQDRKGSNSDIWEGNIFSAEPNIENTDQFQMSWSNRNANQNHDTGYEKHQEINTSWNSDEGSLAQWNGNINSNQEFNERQWIKSNNDYDYA